MKNLNLFEDSNDTKQAPLASRMRPLKLDEIVGQQHIIGKDKLLYRAIKADRLGSIILYGPPGTGKTTIARVIANAKNAKEILTGSLVNAKAIAKYIKMQNVEDVSLVCMGNGGKSEAKEDTLCAEYIKSLLEGENSNLDNEIEELKIIAGKRFFDKNLQDIFPERDFYLATEVNKFNFVLKVEKDQDGMNYIKRIDIN